MQALPLEVLNLIFEFCTASFKDIATFELIGHFVYKQFNSSNMAQRHLNAWFWLGKKLGILQVSADNVLSLSSKDQFFSVLPPMFLNMTTPKVFVKFHFFQTQLLNIKILFCGESGVGKTKLAQRIALNEFIDEYDPNVGMF